MMRYFCKENSSVVVCAPAKINVALHVTGQRPDGYHLLESLVTFSDNGDIIRIKSSDRDHFSADGPYGSSVRLIDDNLVVKARDILRDASGGRIGPVAIHLTKNLPVAAGIGGGSSDAAATLAGLAALDESSAPGKQELMRYALSLGADVPMCLAAIYHKTALVARGIGEEIELLPEFPSLPLVLVNPGVQVTTREVFSGLESYQNLPLIFDRQDMTSFDCLISILQKTRNDLCLSARRIVPCLEEVLQILKQHGAVFARMSGSGATCFGIFYSLKEARKAARQIAKCKPDYFVLPTETYGKI